MVCIFLLTFISSCGIYKYDYDKHRCRILSKHRNSITRLYIIPEKGSPITQFDAIDNTESKIFSLVDFSPAFFKCTNGCPFQFEKGKTYFISVYPKGDRLLGSIKLQVLPDGRIIESKIRTASEPSELY